MWQYSFEAQLLQYLPQSISTFRRRNFSTFLAHCFCLVTFLLKLQLACFFFLFSSSCKNNHHAKSNDPTLCQVPHPFPIALDPAQCRVRSLCALLVSIAKSCVLKVCYCQPPPATLSTIFPSYTHLNFALRRFAVFRVRAFHTKKKTKKNARFVQNLPPTLNSLSCWRESGGGRRVMALGFQLNIIKYF